MGNILMDNVVLTFLKDVFWIQECVDDFWTMTFIELSVYFKIFVTFLVIILLLMSNFHMINIYGPSGPFKMCT